MGIFKKIKTSMGYTATNKLMSEEAEYKLYEMVSSEIASGKKDIGVWTKAFSMSDGIESKAEAQYIELMVQRYKNSIEAGQEMDDILKTNQYSNQPKKPSPKEAKPITAFSTSNQKFANELRIFLIVIIIILLILFYNF